MMLRHYDAGTVWNFRAIPPEYDPEEGRVITARYIDGAVREAIEVRRGLEDAAVLAIVAVELRRRGYTVTPPDPDACPGRCEGFAHRRDCPEWVLPL